MKRKSPNNNAHVNCECVFEAVKPSWRFVHVHTETRFATKYLEKCPKCFIQIRTHEIVKTLYSPGGNDLVEIVDLLFSVSSATKQYYVSKSKMYIKITPFVCFTFCFDNSLTNHKNTTQKESYCFSNFELGGTRGNAIRNTID